MLLKNIYTLYYEGFKNLTIGKTLWKIIIIKLTVLVVVLKLLVYDHSIGSEYQNDVQKSDFVFENFVKGSR